MIDTTFLRGQAHIEKNTYYTGQYDFTNDVVEMCDELDRLYLDTAPLSRADLETVLRGAGFAYLDVNSFGSHEWELRTSQYNEYRGVTIINEPNESISISATYERGVSNPLRKVFRMPPTRATLRSCGVIA